MAKSYFISDAHLGLGPKEAEKEKERRLIGFLDHARKDASRLFILGDLFDAWIEYRTVIPRGHHRLLARLHDLRDEGIEVHYLVGNHDFWMRDYLSSEMGIILHREAFDIELDGKKLLLHHGDGLAANDTGYRVLKTILRNRAAIWLFSWLHPDIGLSLARSSSRGSRSYTSAKEYGESDGMKRFAEERLRNGYDIVVMGHRHVPACEELAGGTYVNLGDWITHNTYAEFTDGRITLMNWNGTQPGNHGTKG